MATGNTTKLRILSAASAHFRDYGFRKTSLNDVAETADVSRQSVYLHFQDKQTLLSAVFEFDLATNLERVRNIVNSERDPGAALTKVFCVWHGQYINRSQRLKAETGRSIPDLPAEIFARSRAELISILAAYLEEHSGRVRQAKTGISAEDIARTLIATSRGLTALSQSEEQYSTNMRTAISVILDI